MKIYTILKIIVVVLLLGLYISPISATSIVSSNAIPTKIFKCQNSLIFANFSDDLITNLTSSLVDQVVTIQGNPVYTVDVIAMNKVASGQWKGTFGNNPLIVWGQRQISFTDNNAVNYQGATIFVYSDTCTGTGVTNYTQIPTGLGRFTSMIYSGQFSILGTSLETSLIGWALFPWIQVWGMLFYFIVIFTVVMVIYIKTQNITQPLTVGEIYDDLLCGDLHIIEITTSGKYTIAEITYLKNGYEHHFLGIAAKNPSDKTDRNYGIKVAVEKAFCHLFAKLVLINLIDGE